MEREPDHQYYADIIAGAAERESRRKTFIIVLLIVLFTLSNAFWVWREMQFTEETIQVEQENEDGFNNFIGRNGDITYGETDDYDPQESP